MALSVSIQGITFEVSPEVRPDVTVTHGANGLVQSVTERWRLTGWLKGSTSTIANQWNQLRTVAKQAPVTVLFVGTGLALTPSGGATGTPRVTSLRATGGNWVSLVTFEMEVEHVTPVGVLPTGQEGGALTTVSGAANVTDARVRSSFRQGADGRVLHRVEAEARGPGARAFVRSALEERVDPENLVSVATETEDGTDGTGSPVPTRATGNAEEDVTEEDDTEAAENADPTAAPLPEAAKGRKVEVFRLLEVVSVAGGLRSATAHGRGGENPPRVTRGPLDAARIVLAGRASAAQGHEDLLVRLRAFPKGPEGGVLTDFDFRDSGPTDFDDRDAPTRFGLEYTATYLVPAPLGDLLTGATHRFEQKFGVLGRRKGPFGGAGLFS